MIGNIYLKINEKLNDIIVGFEGSSFHPHEDVRSLIFPFSSKLGDKTS